MICCSTAKALMVPDGGFKPLVDITPQHLRNRLASGRADQPGEVYRHSAPPTLRPQNSFKHVLLGLVASCLAIAVDALGADRVLAVAALALPRTNDETFAQAHTQGVRAEIID
jgi:hypothetical protein